MLDFDIGFMLAVGTIGWGLSLASYRAFATQYRWPMGSWQQHRPQLPIMVGTLCMLLGTLFAIARIYAGYAVSGWAILVFGVAWAVFWTGFLRVGAQSALLLGPAASALLLFWWLR